MTVNAQENQPKEEKNDKEINFRKQEEIFKKQLEQERSARIAAEQKAEQLEQFRKQKIETNDEDISSDEPYVDQKFLDKKLNKFAQSLEATFEQRAEQKARQIVEGERQKDFMKKNPDFNMVMTQENIEKYGEMNPDELEEWTDIPQSFTRQKLLYRTIKKSIESKKAEVEKSEIQKKIDQNKASPGYRPSGFSPAPYAAHSDFSQEGQKRSYQKMKELQGRFR